jgi:hypothetical protein
MLLGKGSVILKGCGMPPDRSVLQQMAKASYLATPPSQIVGWKLIDATPTLKFYQQGNSIVVAIRGTNPTEKADVEADAKIALNQLEKSARYQGDMSHLLDVMKRYPTSQYDYYGVGHSLGGAILDAFIREGWIKNGVSYNPAVQPRDFTKPTTNQRIYQEGDPLYAVMGRFTPNAEVRPPPKRSIWDRLVRKIPYVGTLFGAVQDHRLDNFEGGAVTRKKKVLKKYGLEDKGYSLSELAKITGVKRSTLQEVYNRGIGAYKTNPLSVRMKGSFKKNVDAPMSQKLSKEQWAMSRVWSFLDGNPKHDTDLRGKGKSDRFSRELGEIGLSPTAYLTEARRRAKASGYESKALSFADDGTHKLAMMDEKGRTTKFGRVGYKDHLMWSHLERKGDVPDGTAEAKKARFQKSHRAMKGDWKSNPYSANNLALRILW